jgi:hypothetical protein
MQVSLLCEVVILKLQNFAFSLKLKNKFYNDIEYKFGNYNQLIKSGHLNITS